MREDCLKSSPCFQSRFFSIKIDYSLRGRMYIVILQRSHPGRLNYSLAIFISMCVYSRKYTGKKSFDSCILYMYPYITKAMDIFALGFNHLIWVLCFSNIQIFLYTLCCQNCWATSMIGTYCGFTTAFYFTKTTAKSHKPTASVNGFTDYPFIKASGKYISWFFCLCQGLEITRMPKKGFLIYSIGLLFLILFIWIYSLWN